MAAAMHLLGPTSGGGELKIRRMMMGSSERLRSAQISFIPKASANSDNSGDGSSKGKRKFRNAQKKIGSKNKKEKEDEGKDEKGSERNGELESSSASSSSGNLESGVLKNIEAVNPVGLGRKSRQIFDEVWRKFSGLGQISRTQYDPPDLLVYGDGAPLCEFTVPGAQNTTVLVTGATSRIGRLVVRKLMLRGYTVKALVRRIDQEVIDMLPRSVQLVVGDVGDPSSLKAAVDGCNKIIYCATARSTITGDLNRVDNRGVYNVAKAFQDYHNKLAQLRAGKSSKSKLLIAKFKSPESLEGWEVRQGTYFQDVVATKYDGEMDAKFIFNEMDWHFSGFVFIRGGYVELSRKLSLPLGSTLDRYEGLVLSVGGNGRSYVIILEAGPLADSSQSKKYFARINTKAGFCRKTVEGPNGMKQEPRRFELILEYIKALPSGQETDFILVSCTGSGVEESRREQVLKAKRAGEDALRKSGLGYTIVRPGPLKEEPGGQRALIFDQGNRISQGISCADVADICVKALHDSTARNKSFDVCYEYIAEQGQELYELVAHLPDKANNYLTPALSVLEKNT
ncbi:hypothetical protein Cgig2_009760 [Carnegiea gigantea]|uniref:NAD(P)-binding domain-containing protein n=1 Tax=Carnegiea gigantea TaxID=171969 RepID=A0A9Q1JV77_9CARY|nr:hypothetical protein Cgig2_009760 [Carnegiea gigantea]